MTPTASDESGTGEDIPMSVPVSRGRGAGVPAADVGVSMELVGVGDVET
jgi:hypothetical protein